MLEKYIVWFTLSFFLLLPSIQSQTCETFTKNATEHICGGVFADIPNFKYYNSGLYTDDELTFMVEKKLNRTMLYSLPDACKSNLLKIGCSSVYVRCVPDVNLLDPTTYSSLNSPVLRPCESTCNQTVDSCLGLLSMMDIPLDCTDTTIFSPYSNSSVCNTMEESSVSIGASYEPLLPINDVCTDSLYGYTTHVFIPPSHKIEMNLPPLRDSYLTQTYLNAKIETVLSSIPPWLTSECYVALKNLLCGKAFMKANVNTHFASLFSQLGVPNEATFLLLSQTPSSAFYGLNATAIWNHAFALPSYLHRDVCTHYHSVCSSLISKVPALNFNCTEQDEDGIQTFPSTSQTVLSNTINGITLTISTEPNTLNTSQSSYTSQCPPRFKVPSNPSDDRNIIVPSSDCAMACPYPIFSEEEIDTNKLFLKYILFVGTIPALLTAIVAKKTWISFCLFFIGLSSLSISISGYVDYEKHHCSSTTTFQSIEKDGFSPCILQSMLFHISSNLAYLFWVSGCKEGFTSQHMTKKEVGFNFLIAFVLLSIGYAQGIFGYRKRDISCIVTDSIVAADGLTIWLPNFLFFTIGMYYLLSNKTQHYGLKEGSHDDEEDDEHDEYSNSKKLSTSLSETTATSTTSSKPTTFYLLCSLISMCLFGSLVMRLVLFVRKDVNEQNLKDWVTCIFEEYTWDSSPSTVHAICGDRLEERMPLLSVHFLVLIRISLPPVCLLAAWMDLSYQKEQVYSKQNKVVPTNKEEDI